MQHTPHSDPEFEVMASTQSRPGASEVFATVQQISSQISKDSVQEVVDKAKGLGVEDSQLVVDVLGMVLEKSHHLLQKADRVLLLLTKLSSSNKTLARNRIIKSEYITSDMDQSSDVYKILGETPTYVTVTFSEGLLTWVHLSHPNVLPIYGVFVKGDDGTLALVSPQMTRGNIVDHVKMLSQAARMPLIFEVIDGLCYLHHLGVVHGALNPKNLLVSHDGRALITGLDSSSESQDLAVRYSAPEMLDEDDTQPKTASDMWSLGCIIYEVLSGKVPFYHIRHEAKVSVAVAMGKKPLRPSQEGAEDINDPTWRPISSCWELDAKDRPSCLQFQKFFSSVIIRDDRLIPKPTVHPGTFEDAKGSTLDLGRARSILLQIFGSDKSIPPSSQIPENLQRPLSGLVDSVTKADGVAVAAKKLSPDGTQILVDVLDLVWEEAAIPSIANSPIDKLLSKVMVSTHVFPRRYKINRIRYDPVPIAESIWGKVYMGYDLDVCVSMITRPGDVSDIIECLALWAHLSHRNLLPLYGVFHESANGVPQFCLVSPHIKNGLLVNYAPRLPQRDRVPLISDVANALVYLQGLRIRCNEIRGDTILISDEGRALINGFGEAGILATPTNMGAVRRSGKYALRFYAPERVHDNVLSRETSAWSFGCLVYEVLSRKPPYYQYRKARKIRSVLSRGEGPKRPSATNDDIDEINDQFWDLIMGCCTPEPGERLTFVEIQKFLQDMDTPDKRPEATSLPGAEALALRSPPDIDWDGVKQLLDQIQVELLRTPLSQLLENHTKDVAAAAAELNFEDTRTIVDFLDLALKNHITLSDERNRVLALLSRITTPTHIFPQRYELQGIKYQSSPIAVGGFGMVHRGVSDPNICVKVMAKVDSMAFMDFAKELIMWAHASHPNVLPFYGVFVDDLKRFCLVSPFMSKGNLHDYAPRLAQKNRIPLLYDVIKGLVYLHGLGIVHTDLKGENVLISDEGHALITDFGASHIITATAKGGVTTASVVSTLRFTAPEIVLNPSLRPTQECDIWSFGCLCYEVLSRQLPFFEYKLETQILAAVARAQPPKRPSSPNDNNDDWDEFDEPDCDVIDDPAWSLITRCCVPKSEDRPNALRIQELIVDLKMWDVRPEVKDGHGARLLSSRSNHDINLNRAGELLTGLQARLLAQRTLRYSIKGVIAAVVELELENDDKYALVQFWDLVLESHMFPSSEINQVLALLSSVMGSTRFIPYRYLLPDARQYNRVPIGNGSFGTVHRGSNANLCIKVTNLARLNHDLNAQWFKALAPSIYSSHPNVLPVYGIFPASSGDVGFLVSPFIRNGNLHDYIPRLGQKLRIPLIGDIVEAITYLHALGIVHGNLKGENILISEEGRALVADSRPYHINTAAAGSLTGPYVTCTLRFTAPELIKNSQMLPNAKSDIWSIGCLVYLVLSRKEPFHHYSQDAEIRAALCRGELPTRPMSTDDGADDIDDQSWNLITKCCAPEPADRIMLPDIWKWLAALGIQDNRLPAKPLPGVETLKLRLTDYGVNIPRAGEVLEQIISRIPAITQDKEREEETQDQLRLTK